MSGRDFISAIHLRYGALYNKARCARGRSENNKLCRRGCGTPETLNHILQQCHKTHFARIQRHNALMNYIQNLNHNRNNTVHKEPTFTVNNKKLKPDLVINSVDRVVLVDIECINDQFSLELAHANKVEKYRCLQDQIQGLRPGGFQCSTLTVNWRGVVAGSSYKELVALQILKKSDFKIISSRVILGGVMAHGIHQRMTVLRSRCKKGEG